MKTTIAIKVLLTERFEPPKEWLLEVPAMPPIDAADLAFRLSNCPPHMLTEDEREILRKHPRTGLRSVSVGDTLIIEAHDQEKHRHILTVAGMGLKFH
jgi:hypothetical protein